MRLPIYIRCELRTNNGNVLRTVERFSVIDTEQDIDELSELLELWAMETGQKFATAVSLQNVDLKELKRDFIRASIAQSDASIAESKKSLAG